MHNSSVKVYFFSLFMHNQHIHKALNVTVMWPIPGQEEIGRSANHYVEYKWYRIIHRCDFGLCVDLYWDTSTSILDCDSKQNNKVILYCFCPLFSFSQNQETRRQFHQYTWTCFHFTCISNLLRTWDVTMLLL